MPRVAMESYACHLQYDLGQENLRLDSYYAFNPCILVEFLWRNHVRNNLFLTAPKNLPMIMRPSLKL